MELLELFKGKRELGEGQKHENSCRCVPHFLFVGSNVHEVQYFKVPKRSGIAPFWRENGRVLVHRNGPGKRPPNRSVSLHHRQRGGNTEDPL
jgi:hypothetical protein